MFILIINNINLLKENNSKNTFLVKKLNLKKIELLKLLLIIVSEI
jgi:hypothetical protein